MTDGTRKLLFEVLVAGRAIQGLRPALDVGRVPGRPADTFRGRAAI
jgi:hypothetical protein